MGLFIYCGCCWWLTRATRSWSTRSTKSWSRLTRATRSWSGAPRSACQALLEGSIHKLWIPAAMAELRYFLGSYATQGLRPQFSHLLQLPDHVAGQCWHRPDISGLHVYQHLSIDGGESTYVKDGASKINLSFKLRVTYYDLINQPTR